MADVEHEGDAGEKPASLLRRMVLPVVVLVLALAAFGVITSLNKRADDSRKAQVRGSAAISALTDLINAPFNADTRKTGPNAARIARAEIESDERIIESAVEAINIRPASRLAAARKDLRDLEAATEVIYRAASRPGGVGGDPRIESKGRAAQIADSRLLKILDQASADNGRRARDARLKAGIGTAAALLALSAIFLAFYFRLIAAHRGTARALVEARDARRAADQANRAKSDFLSQVSHELRTPLHAVLGFGQLLKLMTLPRQADEPVARVLGSGQHLIGLIDDLLEVSQIQVGALRVSLEPVAASRVLDDAMALVRPLAEARDIDLRWDSGATGDAFLLGDAQRVRQILVNLTANAIKYNRQDGRVSVEVHSDARSVRFDVSDTGPGIDPGDAERVFQPFERLEGSGVGGTGLGLSVSRGLAEAMAGTLELTASSPQNGSTFTLGLPRTDVPALAATPPEDVDLHEAASWQLGDVHVLYVDDNEANRSLMGHVLDRSPGTRLTTLGEGSPAFDAAVNEAPDVIVLDLHLPDLPGPEVLAKLKADPRTASIPVIIVSADVVNETVRTMREAGARDYVSKPFRLDQLLNALRGAIAAPAVPPLARDGGGTPDLPR